MQETKPLKGITIVDFTRLLPGPLGTHLLSQLGAKVIKIESPHRMDDARSIDPKIDNTSYLFHCLNATKEIKVIDYQSEEGYKQVCDLIRTADVLVEQFRPGAMANFNLDYEKVKELNPNIVYISVTGYGQFGPYHAKAGHDLNYLATSGLLDLNRDETGKPIIPGFQISDIAGGSYMLTTACTTGLLAQKLQNKPQYIDISLMEASIPINAIPYSLSQGGLNYKSAPILSGMMVNYGVYKTKDDKWVALAAMESKFWRTFCDVIDKPEWRDLKGLELVGGMFPKSEIEDIFRSKTQAEWEVIGNDHDICLSPIVKYHKVHENEHVAVREVIENRQLDNDKSIKIYGQPFKIYSA